MKVAIDPDTHSVVIDGQDVSRLIRRYTFDHHAGRPPEVFLEVANGVSIDGTVLDSDAVVHVMRDADLDLRQIITAWARSLDPDDLDRRVLEDATLIETPGVGYVRALLSVAEEIGGG